MSSIDETPTRCAFVVCRLDEGGEPRFVLMKHPKWGDFTFIGGHQEPEDDNKLDSTARRETLEELGCTSDFRDFQLFPLTEEIPFGPIWSKSAHRVKSYVFKYYGIRFFSNPHLKDGYNNAGFLIRLFKGRELAVHGGISNVVRLFLANYSSELDTIPLSWNGKGSPDASPNHEQQPQNA